MSGHRQIGQSVAQGLLPVIWRMALAMRVARSRRLFNVWNSWAIGETEETVDMDAVGQDRRLHAAMRAHLADIKGWTRLLIREGNQPTLDVARMTLIAQRIEASICALEQQHRQPRRDVDSVP